MNLSEIFELEQVQVRGEQYGWVNTKVDVRPGMPIQIQGSGAINFCNAFGQQWFFTPEGQEGHAARPESLGFGIGGIKHAMLIGRIGNGHIFPIGSFIRFQSREQGPLFVAHNDTKQVSDNDGAWDVRVCMPVDSVKGQRRATGSSAFDVQFGGLWGINGQLSINLPAWIKNPNPRFSIHSGASHGSNIERGMMCVESDVPIWGPIRFKKCIHIQM
jgi:hypothetical protein